MKKSLLVFILIFGTLRLPVLAQLTVNNSMYTPAQLVQNILLGNGVTASNIVYSGMGNAIGFFNGASSNIGLSSGLILTTGDIQNAVGPNNSTFASFINNLSSDSDMDSLMHNYSIDASILEFDFVPSGDTVKFRYVFGSEEYMEFVNTFHNDAVGFFISGPGISGPYTNNSKNIALVPGTTLPITVDNINANLNSPLWFDNQLPPGQTIQYDGFTKVFEAVSEVQCGQTYHVKIAIADGGDAIYDSGIFLEAGSFKPKVSVSFASPTAQCLEGNSYSFSAGGTFGGAASSYAWQFGPGSNPLMSNLKKPAGVNFMMPGLHSVTLTVSENGCTQNFVNNVMVNPMAHTSFTMGTQESCPPFQVDFGKAVHFSGNILSSAWTFGDGTTSNSLNPTHAYLSTGSYDVSVTVMATNIFGCNKEYTFNKPSAVIMNEIPHAEFSATPLVTSIFDPDITFTDMSTNGVNCSLFYGDGSQLNGCNFGTAMHTYGRYGKFVATQILMNGIGCTDTFRLTIDIKPEYRSYIPDAFTVNGDGLNDVFLPKIMGVRNYNFMIFDKWGEELFKTDLLDEGWDGKFNGELCKEDVYVYKISYIDEVDNQYYSRLGKITLLR